MVYFITDKENIKIGYTKQNPEKRLHQLNTGSPIQLYLLGYIEGDKNKEKELHRKFNKYRIRQNGEWFYGNEEIIDYINMVNEKENSYVIKDDDFGIFVTLKI